jgi:hypothetical protein
MKENKKMALKQALSQLMEIMDDMEGEGFGEALGGMKKVTVASPTEEGLEKGLSKAEKILKMRQGMDMDDSEEESEECEGCEEGCENCDDRMPMMMKMKKKKMMNV